MRVLFLGLLLTTFSSAVFSMEESVSSYVSGSEEESILHEMFIGCAGTKAECRQMAHHEGFSTSKTIRDRARCPQRPKTLACIVKH